MKQYKGIHPVCVSFRISREEWTREWEREKEKK